MKKFLTCLIFYLVLGALNFSYAEKIYLDITQPGIKKLSIAIEGFEKVPVVSNTIKDNLEFTEYFKVYGPFPYKGEKFDPSLWRASDIEIVIRASTEDKISVKIFTVTSDSAIFEKDYALNNSESTGNIIASDIYKLLQEKLTLF
jgi:hypothetical protein